MKKQITFLVALFLIFATNIFAQKINTQTVIGSGNANGGSYRYEATIKTKIGSSGSYVDIGISNFKITSFFYQGKDVEKFVEANFPIVINNIQTDVSGRYSIIYLGTGILVGSEPFAESGVQQGDFITRIELEGDNLKSVKDYLKDDKSKIQNISISLYSIELKNEYFEELSRIRDLMDKKLKTEGEIENLKNQIRTLDSDKKEDLVKEIALNKKLQELDTKNTNDYASEIATLQDRLQSIEEKAVNKNTANTKPTLTLKKIGESGSANNSKTFKNDKQIKDNIATQTKIAMQRKKQEEEKQKQQIHNTVSSISSGVKEGIITHLQGSYGWYSLEDDPNKNKNNITNSINVYELGIGFGGVANISLLLGTNKKGQSQSNNDSFVIGGAADVKLLSLLGEDEDFIRLGWKNTGRKYLIKAYGGLEYISYMNEYNIDDRKFEYSGGATGIRFTGILFNFILLQYSFGTDKGEVINSSETIKYSLPYSKVSLGLQINF